MDQSIMMMEGTALKEALYNLCLAFVNTRINTASTALQQAREAANDDTKSSAGDKFETTREMMQQDIERNKRLLMDAEASKQMLTSLRDVPSSAKARNGNLVRTDQGNFYLGIGAGQLQLENQTIFAISSVSPIGKLLLGRQQGDLFEFNGKKYTVTEVI